MLNSISKSDIEHWHQNGFLVFKNFFESNHAKKIISYVEDIAQWPETPQKWMRYYENNSHNQKSLCRVENFLPYHDRLRDLLNSDEINGLIGQLAGEEVVIFKEKINFKYPGGKGFRPHQDAPAFVSFGQTFHISLLISIDRSTKANGCIEMVKGQCEENLLRQAQDGTLDSTITDAFTWIPIETEPTDLVLFNSYVPHRSHDNHSTDPRRALYVTYNRKSEGDYRGRYYADKREKFPPECERVAGVDYSQSIGIYNLANPIE